MKQPNTWRMGEEPAHHDREPDLSKTSSPSHYSMGHHQPSGKTTRQTEAGQIRLKVSGAFSNTKTPPANLIIQERKAATSPQGPTHHHHPTGDEGRCTAVLNTARHPARATTVPTTLTHMKHWNKVQPVDTRTAQSWTVSSSVSWRSQREDSPVCERHINSELKAESCYRVGGVRVLLYSVSNSLATAIKMNLNRHFWVQPCTENKWEM